MMGEETVRVWRAVLPIAAMLGAVCACRTGVTAEQAATPEKRQATRPNIVLIMADDMGFSDIGCYGGEIATPNLDRLAADGLRFTQFYNCAKCTTTRASLMTGLYPRPRGGLLKTNMVTIGEVLREAGYQTSLSGKWHLGRSKTRHPFHRGFDQYYGLLDGCCNFFNPVQPDPRFKGGRIRVFGKNDAKITEFPADYYTTDAFTDHAVKNIRNFSRTGRPFFVHVCYTAPHYPLHAKPQDIAKYRGKYLLGWNALRRRRHARLVKMGLIDKAWKLSSVDSRSYDWESANQPWEDLRMAVYAAMIDSMDQNIGRILSALREEKVDRNTLILFLSDNGGCAEEPGGRNEEAVPGPREHYTAVGPAWGWAQNAPFTRYKSWVNEGGISTPLIVRWPQVVRQGGITHQVGHLIDIMATCVDAADTEYPLKYAKRQILPLEGDSLVPIFRGKRRRGHQALYWEWAGNRAVRRGKWKLVWDKLIKRWQLFDMEADRTETFDLASRFPDKKKALADAWKAWAKRTGVRN